MKIAPPFATPEEFSAAMRRNAGLVDARFLWRVAYRAARTINPGTPASFRVMVAARELGRPYGSVNWGSRACVLRVCSEIRGEAGAAAGRSFIEHFRDRVTA